MKLLPLVLLLFSLSVGAKEVARSEGTQGTAYLTDEACPFSQHPELAYAYGVNKKTGKKDIEGCWTLYDGLVVFLVPGQEPVAFEEKNFVWKSKKL